MVRPQLRQFRRSHGDNGSFQVWSKSARTAATGEQCSLKVLTARNGDFQPIGLPKKTFQIVPDLGRDLKRDVSLARPLNLQTSHGFLKFDQPENFPSPFSFRSGINAYGPKGRRYELDYLKSEDCLSVYMFRSVFGQCSVSKRSACGQSGMILESEPLARGAGFRRNTLAEMLSTRGAATQRSLHQDHSQHRSQSRVPPTSSIFD